MSLGPADLVRGPRSARGLPEWPQLPAGRTLATHRARGALAIACTALGIGPGDEVLMPAYNCGTEIEAVRSTGAAVTLHRIDSLGRIDVEDLRTRVTPRTRAVVVVHYLGWPQALADVVDVCAQRGLRLIEDCAHSLFSSEDGKWTGSTGDAAVFSFPKSLAVPDGGAVRLNAGDFGAAPELVPPASLSTLRRSLGLVRSRWWRGLRRPADLPVAAAGARPDLPADYYWNPARARWAMSRTTRRLLLRVDPALVVERRRRNFARLLSRLTPDESVAPLHTHLPQGTCPLGFPLVVAGDKQTWVDALRARGVHAIPWWSGYHRDLPWDGFPDACRLKETVLTVPIHQGLDDGAMDWIGEQVADAARSLRAGR